MDTDANNGWVTIAEAEQLTGKAGGTIRDKIADGTLHAERRQSTTGQLLMVKQSELLASSPSWNTKDRVLSTSDPRNPDELLLRDIAAQIGEPVNSIYQWIKTGRVSGRKVSLGPGKSPAWVGSLSEAVAFQKDLERRFPQGRGTKRRGYKPPQRKNNRIPAPQVTVATLKPTRVVATTSSDLLANKLMEIADFVQNNPMVEVVSCEVQLKFKG